MMNCWEPIHGKPVVRVPRSHSVDFLHLSNGGQGPTVGLTRMSRGRQKEQVFAPGQTAPQGFRKQRHRSTSPKANATAASTATGAAATAIAALGGGKKNKRTEFYLQECEVTKKKKQTLFQVVGNDIGIERIAKACGKIAEEDELLKPLKDQCNIPLSKTLLGYLLGQKLPEFALLLPELKQELIRARDEFGLTSEHFDRMTNMFRKAVHTFCTNNATRLEWDTISDCFRKEIEKGSLHRVTDKRVVSFDVFIRGCDFLPLGGDKQKIIQAIIKVAKQLPDPDVKRAVMRSFYPEAITLTEATARPSGLMLKFRLMPSLYEDRIVLKQTDLGHTKQFLDQLHLEFDPQAQVAAELPNIDLVDWEAEDKIVKQRNSWRAEAKAITEKVEEIIPPEDPDYDGLKLENELAQTLHPGPSIMELYPSLPTFDGDQKIVFEEQNRRIALLEGQLGRLATVHAKELTRTRKMLMLAQDRIGELEEMTTLLPTEAAQAQNLVFRITQDSIKRTLRQGHDDLESNADSLHMLESCPTPTMYYAKDTLAAVPRTPASPREHAPRAAAGSVTTAHALTAHQIYSAAVGAAPNPLQTGTHGTFDRKSTTTQDSFRTTMNTTGLTYSSYSRLMPGEDIDTKLREWIETSQRMLDPTLDSPKRMKSSRREETEQGIGGDV